MARITALKVKHCNFPDVLILRTACDTMRKYSKLGLLYYNPFVYIFELEPNVAHLNLRLEIIQSFNCLIVQWLRLTDVYIYLISLMKKYVFLPLQLCYSVCSINSNYRETLAN